MKILFITQFFHPDIQATSQIFTDLCEDLAKEYQVNVVCGMPLVCAGENIQHTKKGKQIYKEITIIRVNSFSRKRKSFFDRIVNHISFAWSSFVYLLFNRKADIVFISSDNPLSFFNMLLFLQIPRIYICQDLYFEQGQSIGVFKKNILGAILNMAQRLSLHFATKVVVLGERMKNYLNENGIEKNKIKVISNWADTKNITPESHNNLFAKENKIDGKFVVLHSGRIGLTQDLEMLLQCAHDMQHYEDIVFVIVGEGAKKKELIDITREKNLSNVIFLPYQPKQRLKYCLASASVSVVLVKGGLSRYLIPSKIYGILASARPVIVAIDKNSQAHDIIDEAQCGFLIAPGDLQGLKESILSIYENRDLIGQMGKRGRDFVENRFSRTIGTKAYKNLTETTVKTHE